MFLFSCGVKKPPVSEKVVPSILLKYQKDYDKKKKK